MGHVTLQNTTMKFGDFTAVKDVSLEIEKGEFFSFLGPSGCGKTTILRMISGFNEPTSGAVFISGKNMKGIGPNKRPTALIFQNLALFPLMSVADNIAFGLEVRGVSAKERRKKADRLLDLIALSGSGDKKIGELSGGQKQRVAIARALAVEPEVLLLDEPLSALDLKLRQHMRSELRDIQKKTGVTFIYITHDQGEAMTMSDRVAVMSAGEIEQVSKPEEIYDNPATPFVSTFVGENNPFFGRVREAEGGQAVIETIYGDLRGKNTGGLKKGEEAVLFIRPERIKLANGGGTSGMNTLECAVSHQDFEGSFVNLFLKRKNALSDIVIHLTNDGRVPAFSHGESAKVVFSPEHARVMKKGAMANE